MYTEGADLSSASDLIKRACEASTSPSGELWDEVGGFDAPCASSAQKGGPESSNPCE
jgi:hypothetical protein